VLRKHIPKRYQAVSGHRGNTIKISTCSADPKEAERRLPDMLKRWAEMQAEWERKLSVVRPAGRRLL
jgi:16S rRNA C967 or C1407 C5-methylase (RsmB/RsmF family)